MLSPLPKMPLVLVATLVVLAFAPSAESCTPLPGDPQLPVEGMARKMIISDIVLYGYGNKVIPSDLDADVYSVEFETKCIYKKPKDLIIYPGTTINEVGEVPRLCYSTNITIGQDVIVYLTQGDDLAFRPLFSSDPGEEQYREELMGLCEFNPEYPVGVEEMDKDYCKKVYDYDDCLTEEDIIPVETVPIVPVVPEVPVVDKEEVDEEMVKEEVDTGKSMPESTEAPDTEVPYKPSVSEDKEMSNKDNDENAGNGVAITLTLLVISLITVAVL